MHEHQDSPDRTGSGELLKYRRRSRVALTAVMSVFLLAAGAFSTDDQVGITDDQPKITDVRIEGSHRLDKTTILFHTSSQPGTLYDPVVAQEDFRKLWATGFFDDLRLELETGADGVTIIWRVSERPHLSSLRYEGNEGIIDEDIRSHLKDRGIELRDGAPVGHGQIERARVYIEELFRERGYRFVSVSTDVTAVEREGSLEVVVRIDEGSKVKIAKLEFEGNRAFDDGDLRGQLKKSKQGGFACFLTKKCVFNETSFNEDLERLRDFYFDRGYINFAIGEPAIEAVGDGDKRRLEITIPVTEGRMFVVGQVSVEGSTAFPSELLLKLNRLQVGQPFSRKKMTETRQDISELYGLKGYFNVLITPRFEQANEGEVNLIYKVTEGDPYYVHRIAFRGNTSTKDKVIRRQMNISEGDLFNTALFKRSLFRIYQLGYFDEPQPKIEPSEEDPTKLDITIDLQEQGRNDVRFGGGVSAVDGFFGTLAFSTRNLFGSGNSLTVDVQSGRRVKQYRVAYFDPYLFDRSISSGIDLFDREIKYTDFEQRGRGGIGNIGFRVRDFWFLQASYRYEEVDQSARERTDLDGNPVPIDEFDYLRFTDQRRVSSLSPILSFSSIDNPVRPWRGFRQLLSFEYTGGFLGGTTNLIKPRIDSTLYLPFSRRVGLAVHGEASTVTAFNDDEVPLFERFFLGGERSLRGYRAFQVGPRESDAFGNSVVVGGDKMLVFNTELQLRVADPVSLVLFADAGNAFADDESISFSGLKTSFGAEVRFWTPLLQAPLRLIYSYVPEPLIIDGKADPHTDFTFSIGTTF